MAAEVLVVVGAQGGCGASTLAAVLARERAARGDRAGRVALVDLDHGRGGLEVLLGIEDRGGARWSDLAQVRGRLAGADLEGVLPRWGRVEVLSADRSGAEPAPQTLTAVWGALVESCSTVVVDLPGRALVPGGASEILAARKDLLLVTGQDVLGVAGGLAARSRVPDGPVQLVLRGRRRARVAPLEAARVLDLPMLALVPTDRRLAEATDRGLGPLLARRSRMARVIRHLARRTGDG